MGGSEGGRAKSRGCDWRIEICEKAEKRKGMKADEAYGKVIKWGGENLLKC